MKSTISLFAGALASLLLLAPLSAQSAGKPINFRTHLTGAEEVPPVATRAQGQAIFQLSADGSELRYKLIVANIQNITQAHIHLGAKGTNGDVIAWLYPSASPPVPIPGRFNGVLAEGVITASSLVGDLAGSTDLAELIVLMAEGMTYVNVHTSQFPGGEVRGQIFGQLPGN